MSPVWSVSSARQWNRFAAAHPGANLLQSGSWGDLKARYCWRVARLAVGDADAPRGGVQLLTRTRRIPPLGPSVGLAYVPRGPLAESDADARVVDRGGLGGSAAPRSIAASSRACARPARGRAGGTGVSQDRCIRADSADGRRGSGGGRDRATGLVQVQDALQHPAGRLGAGWRWSGTPARPASTPSMR